jgi:hypothetical protein
MPVIMTGIHRQCRTAAILAGLLFAGSSLTALAESLPYPKSDHIDGLSLDWSTMRKHALGSDNWPATWASNGDIIASWGDGGGFGNGASRTHYSSLGFARLSGSNAATLRGQNMIGGPGARVSPCFPRLGGMVDTRNHADTPQGCAGKGLHGKTYSLLALDNELYSFILPGSDTTNYKEARLYRSSLSGRGWKKASWAFTAKGPERLVSPGFLQAGRGYADGGSDVYAYAARYAPVRNSGKLDLQRGRSGGEIALLRAPRGSNLMSRSSWSYFAGTNGSGNPQWSSSASAIKPVITDRSGVAPATSAIYVKQLNRYLVATEHGAHAAGRFTVLESPNPWGPWKTVARTQLAGKGGAGKNAFYINFLPNSFNGDDFTLLMTGRNADDALLAVDGSFKGGVVDNGGGGDGGEDTAGGGGPADESGIGNPPKDPRDLRKERREKRREAKRERGRERQQARQEQRHAQPLSRRTVFAAIADHARHTERARSLTQGQSLRARRNRDMALGLGPAMDAPGPFAIGAASFDALLDPSMVAHDPSRGQFDRAMTPENRDGGAGVTYAFGADTRLAMALTSYGDSSQHAEGRTSLLSQGVTMALEHDLGGFALETRLAYSADRYTERGAGGSASFDGSSTAAAQRVGYALQGEGFTLTPWSELGYESLQIDDHTLASRYAPDTKQAGGTLTDMLASIGLDASAKPITLSERSSLSLHGSLSYTHGVSQTGSEFLVEAGLGDEDTLAPSRAVGLSFGASLDLSTSLAIDTSVALEHDFATDEASAAPRVQLTWRF